MAMAKLLLCDLDSLFPKLKNLSHAHQLHAHLITTGQFLHHHISPPRSKLLELYSLTLHNLSFAIQTFALIPFPSSNDWNAILRAQISSPQPIHAFNWFKTMMGSLESCKKIDALTCSFVLKACARALARDEARQVHTHVMRNGFYVDSLLSTTLLDLYAKVADLDSCKKVFDEMSQRDVAVWNALICGFAQGSRAVEALSLFKRMEREGFKPNEVSVLGCLSACSHLGAINEGERIYEYVMNEGLDGNVSVCNAVIDMYCKCGFVDKAYKVFEGMKSGKSVVTWNTMIMGFGMNGDGYKALELFEKVREIGVKPDGVTYLAVLCACNHAGLVDEGFGLFNSMERCGVNRNVKHYGSVVDLLGRGGRLLEAYDVINSMPTVPDIVLWQTLLGACRTFGNVEMAETVSQKLMEMGTDNDGDFVLLSNLYAAEQRWTDVERVRHAMKNRDVKKVPGFSYIEGKGIIHTFYNGDKSHENWREIYAKLDVVRLKIKDYGYVGETRYVLHDIGEEEKENALYHHSEKLAVAFGLINTDEGATIQVIKNLRICGDCHVVIKLISKIYNREIIVRDRVRFHRFKEGFCSCREYW